MELALGFAVSVVTAIVPDALGAVFRIASLAAEDTIAVGAAVLPGDDHLLYDDASTLFDDCPGIFPRHSGTLRGSTELVNFFCWRPTRSKVWFLLDVTQEDHP